MAELMPLTQLRDMLDGNRRLTVRTLQAFPDEALFTHAAPGMRTAADMFKEIIEIDRAQLRGIATGKWAWENESQAIDTKQGLLDAFAQLKGQAAQWWEKITPDRLLTVEDDGFGWAPPMPNLNRVMYGLENEVHHRGQVYVYLRQLGVEPPVFYER
ncbi:MAG TPA: DinB family protein [Symbiobacteriaceae bacterium]|nr:DinB family protein [Symbiobacteriaceae bacterium]